MKAPDAGPPLRIGQVAPLWTSVPPTTYGGIERRVGWLSDELVRRGHDVTLFATADSITQARLHPIYPRGVAQAMGEGNAFVYEYYLNAAIGEALRHSDSFDVIHFHLGCVALPFTLLSKAAVLHSIPTELTADDLWMLNQYPEVAVNTLSRQQAEPIDPCRRRSVQVVYNGCDFEAYTVSKAPGRYLVFLGRMGEHKSPVNAIRIARELNFPIRLAGAPVTLTEERYFAEHVLPLVDGRNVIYVGPVNDLQKDQLFRNAIALLFPIHWDEPFGNVMIEAMACGVPVVACRRGSVAEVIDYGITGFYADSVDDLPALVRRAAGLDRLAIREHARRRFSYQRMVDDYEALYRSVVSRFQAGACPPKVVDG